MGPVTHRRRRAKPPSGRLASSEINQRNERFRYVNQFGKRARIAFIALLVTGYILICGVQIQVVVSPEAAYAFGAALSSAVVGAYGMRRHQR